MSTSCLLTTAAGAERHRLRCHKTPPRSCSKKRDAPSLQRCFPQKRKPPTFETVRIRGLKTHREALLSSPTFKTSFSSSRPAESLITYQRTVGPPSASTQPHNLHPSAPTPVPETKHNAFSNLERPVASSTEPLLQLRHGSYRPNSSRSTASRPFRLSRREKKATFYTSTTHLSHSHTHEKRKEKKNNDTHRHTDLVRKHDDTGMPLVYPHRPPPTRPDPRAPAVLAKKTQNIPK